MIAKAPRVKGWPRPPGRPIGPRCEAALGLCSEVCRVRGGTAWEWMPAPTVRFRGAPALADAYTCGWGSVRAAFRDGSRDVFGRKRREAQTTDGHRTIKFLLGRNPLSPDGLGTSEQPLPSGAIAHLDRWDVALVSSRVEQETTSRATDPPDGAPTAQGRTFVFRIRATFTDDEDGQIGKPWSLSANFTGRDGQRRYGDSLADRASALKNQPDVPLGETIEGDVWVAVPDELPLDGAVEIAPLMSLDPSAWFAVSPQS